MQVEKIAQVAHAVNAAFCQSIGDDSQTDWDSAPEWQQQSALAGVELFLENPQTTPEQGHAAWLAQKTAEGWTYGEEKNAEAKTHPCCVPYADLSQEQKSKDYIFRAVVKALATVMKDASATGLDSGTATTDAQSPHAPTQAPGTSTSTQVSPPSGYVGVEYIGRRELWVDTIYSSGLNFTSAQRRSIPLEIGRKLLRHADLFRQTSTVDADETTAQSADDTEQLLDNGKREQADNSLKEDEFSVIDQVNQMDQATLSQFAMERYAMKLDKRSNLESNRAKVIERINQVGVA
jgi:hypothetical protein